MNTASRLFATLLVCAFVGTAYAAPQLIVAEGAPVEFTPAHDPNCFTAYSNVDGIALAIRPAGALPKSLMDDLHLTTTSDAALCAFTVQARSISGNASTATVNFRSGGAGDPVPGPVTAGPFTVNIGTGFLVHTIHVEANSGYVSPNAYIEILWDVSEDSGFRVANVPTVGTSHDTWYFLPDGTFNDNGDTPANIYAEVFVSPPTPAQSSTWGTVKAIYR